MARREYSETPLTGGITSFQTGSAPAAPGVAATDFSGIRQTLNTWAQNAVEKSRAKEQQRVKELAIEQQQELGVSGVAAPDSEWDQRYRDAFTAAASEVFVQNLEVDSTRVDNELKRRHMNDPQGYLAARQAYVDQSLSGLQEQDVELHQIAKNSLDRQTNSTFSRLADVSFQNEIKQNKAQAKLNFEQTATQAVQELLEPGADREMLVAERSGDLYAQLARDLDLGLITDVEYNQSLSVVDDTLYFGTVRGDVQDALNNGDFGVVQGYIDDLNRGVGVTFALDEARRLSDEIRVDMNRVKSATGGAARALLQNAKIESSILLAGGTPDETVAGSMRALQEYGANTNDPEVRATVNNMLVDHAAAVWVRDDLNASDIDTLEADIDRFRNNPNLSPQYREKVVQKGTARIQEIRAAQDDPQALRDLFPDQPPAEVARITGLDPADVPTYSTGQIAKSLPDAVNRGELSPTLDSLLLNSQFGGNDLVETLVRAQDLPDHIKAAAITSVKLKQNGMLDLAEQVANSTGVLTSEQQKQFAKAFENAEGVTALVGALSYGDPAVRGQLQRGMALLAAGRVDRSEDVDPDFRDVAEQVVREMESGIELVEIAGRTYPALDFALPGEGPEAARARARGLGDNILDELEAQGKSTEGVIMRPTAEGGIEVFANLGYNTRLMSPDGDAVWTFDEVADARDDARLENARARDAIEQERANPRWTQTLTESDPTRANQATLADINDRIATISRSTGVEQPLLRAVVAASDKLTPEQKANRNAPMAEAPGGRGGADSRVSNLDGLPNVFVFEQGIEGGEAGFTEQAEWISKTQKALGDDPRKILAAYWSSRSEVKALVDEFGDDWFDSAPATMRNFVRNGMEFYESDDFQYVPKAFRPQLKNPAETRGPQMGLPSSLWGN